MKKILLFTLLLLSVIVLALNGCSQSTSPASAISATSILSGLGQMCSSSTAYFPTTSSLSGITPLGNIKAASTLTRHVSWDAETKWWTSVMNYTSTVATYDATYTYQWLNGSTAVMYPTNHVTTQLRLYCTISGAFFGESLSLNLGTSTSTPLIISHLNTSTPEVNGTISATGSSSGTTYAITLNYSNLSYTLASGYPSGSVNWTVAVSGATVYSGTITFDGDATALIAFSSGTTGSYLVNLNTGLISVASIK